MAPGGLAAAARIIENKPFGRLNGDVPGRWSNNASFTASSTSPAQMFPRLAMEFILSLRDLLPAQAVRIIDALPKGLVKFLAVGLTGLAIHTSVFTVVLGLGVDKSPSWGAGLVASTLVAWSLNRKVTFGASGRRRRDEMARYALVTLVAQGISFSVFHLACRLAPDVWPQLCVLAGAATATIFSYTGQRFFTFAPQRLVNYGV
jgi:putative flippase GtrA